MKLSPYLLLFLYFSISFQQNFLPYFYSHYFSIYTFNKTCPPYFYFPIFSSPNKTFLPIFTPTIFLICTLNKTLPRGGRSPKWMGKLESEIGGKPELITGGKIVLNFDSRFGRIEATANNSGQVIHTRVHLALSSII